jgi:hypothetical protein
MRMLLSEYSFFVLANELAFMVLQKKNNDTADKHQQYQVNHYCEDLKFGFPHIKLNVNIRYIMQSNIKVM